MQDEIVSRLANQLQAELIAAEARRAERSPKPDSMDLYFQGRASINRGLSPDLLVKARKFFEQALELDRSNVDALVGVGTMDWLVGQAFMTDDPSSFLAAAEAKFTQALAAAPKHARAHWALGYVLCATNRASRGMEEFGRALAIDPNFAAAHAGFGFAHVYVGRAEETEAHVMEALRLSPRDARINVWFLHAATAKMLPGEFDEAAARLGKAIDTSRKDLWAHFYLAACFAHLGRLDEAREALKAGLAVNPKFTIERFRRGLESYNARFLAQRQRVIEGMRKAGVPEE
jgi:tetratricopeptide (TPR) repeat protein